MRKIGCFLLLIIGIGVLPAHANDITLYMGIQSPEKLTLRSAAQAGANIPVDPAKFGTFGIRIGHGRVFGGEHTIAYSPNFIETRTKAIIYNSNMLIQAPLPGGIRPYGTAGFGTVITKGDGIADFGSKFAVNYGGGLKFIPGGPVGARIDIRGYTLPSVQDQTLNILEVSVGVIFSF
jgi:hypothetical protein